jgi:hypothetical protein
MPIGGVCKCEEYASVRSIPMGGVYQFYGYASVEEYRLPL